MSKGLYLFNLLMYLVYYLLHSFSFLFSFFVKNHNLSRILISAGPKGWECIDLKEIRQSAFEYFGEKAVITHSISNNDIFVSEVGHLIKSEGITHFFYDPRSGYNSYRSAFLDCIRLYAILLYYNVTPIIYLTDVSNRIWRFKSIFLSALKSVSICFVDPILIHPLYPNKSLIGPSLMPLSISTMEKIKAQDKPFKEKLPRALFMGSLYEPRTSSLNQISECLRKSNHKMEIVGRSIGSKRKPDSEYWSNLCSSMINFTTSDQLDDPNFDWNHIPNLVYRYLESMVCGSLLIAKTVPGIEKYFKPYIHFVPYTSNSNAANTIEYYLTHSEEAMSIAQRGQKKASDLISSNIFWLQIDLALGKNGFNLSFSN